MSEGAASGHCDKQNNGTVETDLDTMKTVTTDLSTAGKVRGSAHAQCER